MHGTHASNGSYVSNLRFKALNDARNGTDVSNLWNRGTGARN